MKIHYLGTAAAEGVPAIFCKCNICENIRLLGEREYRSRSQVIIDDILSIDFPPDAYIHSLKYGVHLSDIKYILASHSHMDHFYAHDFILRGYKYAYDFCDVLNIYGNGEVNDVFNECTLRELKSEVKDKITIHTIEPYNVYSIGKYTLITLPAIHSNTESVMLFYITDGVSGYLHLYDTALPNCDFNFLKEQNVKIDVISFDCTFLDDNSGTRSRHMNIYDCNLIRDKLLSLNLCSENCKYVITHFSHNCNPTSERVNDVASKFGYIGAFDGLKIEV